MTRKRARDFRDDEADEEEGEEEEEDVIMEFDEEEERDGNRSLQPRLTVPKRDLEKQVGEEMMMMTMMMMVSW